MFPGSVIVTDGYTSNPRDVSEFNNRHEVHTNAIENLFPHLKMEYKRMSVSWFSTTILYSLFYFHSAKKFKYKIQKIVKEKSKQITILRYLK